MPEQRNDAHQDVHYVGVDVSKAELEVAVEHGATKTLARRAKDWSKWLEAQQGTALHIVAEATGGFEQLVLEQCHARGIPCSIVNPARVRHFARAVGIGAKTDLIDAQVLVRFGRTLQPRLTEPPTAERKHLRALVERRVDLLQTRTAEKNRLKSPGALVASIQAHIDWLDTQVDELEQEIRTVISTHSEMADQAARMEEIKGVGPVTAATVLALLPELGQLNRREIVALVGLAPYAHDSGPRRGKRRIYGGRAKVRTALYMASMVASTWNPHLKAFANRLRQRGKPSKVVFTAVARKLLTYLNAMVRDGAQWAPRQIDNPL